MKLAVQNPQHFPLSLTEKLLPALQAYAETRGLALGCLAAAAQLLASAAAADPSEGSWLAKEAHARKLIAAALALEARPSFQSRVTGPVRLESDHSSSIKKLRSHSFFACGHVASLPSTALPSI